jgi:hypothetical protein
MSVWVAGATVVGSIGSALITKSGQKAPQTAAYTPVDIGKGAKDAIDANLDNLDQNKFLASQTNTFAQDESLRLIEQAMPGFTAAQSRLMQSFNDDLDSQTTLPKDVQSKIEQFAAEKGISRGTSGNFNDFSLVKDFGFNLIDWQNAKRASALQTLSTVFGMAPRVNPMSPMAMFVDPNVAISAQVRDNENQYSIGQAAANATQAASATNAGLLGGAFSSSIGALGSLFGGGGAAAGGSSGSLPSPDSLRFGTGGTPNLL